MIKQWYTARELAEFELEGMPKTERAYQIKAEKQNWNNRDRLKGKGKEYHVDNLSDKAKSSLIDRVVGENRLLELESKADTTDILNERGRAKFTEKERSTARLVIVSLFNNFRAGMAMGITEAEQPFVKLYESEKAKEQSSIIPQWVFEVYPKFSIPTLRIWRSKAKDGLIQSKHGHRKGKGTIERAEDGKLAEYIIALITKQTHITAGNVRDACRTTFGETVSVKDAKSGKKIDKDLPNVRTFERFIQKWKDENNNILLKLTDPDRYKNKYQVAFGDSAHDATALNKVWEIDASPVDAMCIDGRWNLYAIIDVYSRRVLFSVSRTAKTDASLMLIRRAILEWGVPDTIKTDQGTDFKSYHFQNALISLGIEQYICTRFTPEGKPHVERVFKTLQHDLMPMLPGYIGHNVADRSKIEQTKAFSNRLGEDQKARFGTELTSEELQDYIDRWAKHKYGDRIHSSIKQSPNERAQNWRGAIKRIDNERTLDLLLAPIASGKGYRKVTKKGIRTENSTFIAPELALIVGKQVFVRHDPDDMGRIYVFENENGEFICEAVNNQTVGLSRKELTEEAKKAQKIYTNERTKEIKAVQRTIKPIDMVDALLKKKADESENVIHFKPETTHSSPAIKAAENALNTYEPLDETPLTDQQKTEHEALAKEMEAPKPQVISLNSREGRIQKSVNLEERLTRGEHISSKDQSWLDTYQKSAEWSAYKTIMEDFGGDWFNEKGEY